MKHLYFFRRMIGRWQSNRTRFYPENNTIERRSVEIDIDEIENADTIRLITMHSTVDLMFCKRENVFYCSKHGLVGDPIKVVVDPDITANEMKTTFEFDGMFYHERYTFVDDDCRLRALVCKKDDKIVLVNQYIEYRIKYD